MKPLITVIVPTYNRPELLKRALESITKQKYRHYEVLVINDGGENVEQVVSGYRNTRYISRSINQGLPAARNAGLRVAKGDWIAYLDDDDWFYEWHLDVLISGISKARFVYSDADAIWPNRKIKLYMSVDPDPGNILSHNITPVCCVLHDRWLINEVGPFDEMLPNHEDWDLWIRMSQVATFHHIKSSTCCIDRTRPTMGSDTKAMLRGMLFVKNRYRKDLHADPAILRPQP